MAYSFDSSDYSPIQSAKIANTNKTKGLSKYIFAPMELIVDTRIILNATAVGQDLTSGSPFVPALA
jgi:ribosomal protein L2